MTAKILVADDSITIQKIVAMAFENEDATVEGINNGSEALARIQTFKPDIVLADIDMPGLTGFELSRKIKESSEFNSIHVLLLASDFEEFDENLFQSSLADNHITKPFKSEDLVRKVMAFLDTASPDVEEEMEEVIELSVADRVIEDVVLDPDDDQQMNSHKEISLEDEDAILDLPLNQEPVNFDEEEAEPEAISAGMDSPKEISLEDEDAILNLPLNQELVNFDGEEAQPEAATAEMQKEGLEGDPVVSDPPPEARLPGEIAAAIDDPVEEEEDGTEEDLDELLLKVEELSRKSEEISDNGQHEKLSPMEAIDEMLKEVSALKEDSLFASGEAENNASNITEPQLSADPNSNGAILADVDYISEENAEALATAFDEITNGKQNPFSETATDLPEPLESFFQEDTLEQEPENPTENFSDPFLSNSQENLMPNNQELPSPPSSKEEPPSSTEQTVESMETPEESLLPEEEQLKQFMEKEVRKILQESLAPLIEKEISGLSDKILRAVEENVRQVTPGIAKTIIEKEIDKIKTMEEG